MPVRVTSGHSSYFLNRSGILTWSRTFLSQPLAIMKNSISYTGKSKNAFLTIRSILVLSLLLLGSGVEGWAQSQTFTSSAIFTVPAGVTSVTVEAWGGGGAGGGTNTTNRSTGGGGAGGTYTKSTIAVTPGDTISVKVGAGGSGVLGAAGSPGGTSFFRNFVSAIGGSGGGLGDATNLNGIGAGVATGTNFNGGAGGTGTATSGGSGNSGAGGGGAGNTGSGGSASGATAGTGGTGGTGATGGQFNERVLIFGGTDTIETHREALRSVGILTKRALPA